MSINLNEDWLNSELKKEVLDLFQPLYKHPLTETEVTNIANTLANTAELWIKFNWRIDHAN
ncbi:MAG: hypothetical protein PHD49_00140 [Candidatus Shapirobacteria bacterium]|nr:hypothetical protein [Candidatus Shapirobacteria bacterium]